MAFKSISAVLLLCIISLSSSAKFYPEQSHIDSVQNAALVETSSQTAHEFTVSLPGQIAATDTTTQTIFKVNDTYTWLREPLLMRLPDGSLFCEIFTGGKDDGKEENIVAGVISDDDGETWSELEVIKSIQDTGCWASSVFVDNDKAYIFWYVIDQSRNNFTNKNAHLLRTGPDGRTFTQDTGISGDWNTDQCIDVRRGIKLRDGKILLMGSWKEIVPGLVETEIASNDPRRLRWANVDGANLMNKVSYCGVLEPNEDFTKFKRSGRIHKLTPDGELPSIPFFENQIAELSDGSLAMLIRADMTNCLWRSNSFDKGSTWTEPFKTDIPNPGSKFLIINLPDGRIVLFHNPSKRDYDDSTGHWHKSRTPLEMWVSEDDMKTWSYKETLVSAPTLAQYPDGFYDASENSIYLVWEDDFNVYFKKIQVKKW